MIYEGGHKQFTDYHVSQYMHVSIVYNKQINKKLIKNRRPFSQLKCNVLEIIMYALSSRKT